MLTVKCPSCGNGQKTNPKVIIRSVKRCVYCGRSFKIHSGNSSRIIASR